MNILVNNHKYKPFLFFIIILILLEFLTRIFIFLGVKLKNQPPLTSTPHISSKSIILQQEWGEELLLEMKDLGMQLDYYPFEEFRMKPHKGKFFNVGDDGFRITNHLRGNAYNIWIFGGSTIAGAGVPDQFTVPYYVQEIFNKSASLRVNIYNRGIAGWINSQELIHLVNELRSGRKPDMAIFYDGVNEIAKSVIYGMPTDMPRFYMRQKDLMDGNMDLLSLFVTRRSKFAYQLVNFIRKTLNLPIPLIPFVDAWDKDFNFNQYPNLGEERKQKLAEEIVDIYFKNIDFIKKLASVYNFKVYFFWQPSLWTTKKTLTLEERNLLDSHHTCRFAYIDSAKRVETQIKIFLSKNPNYSKDFLWIGDAVDRLTETVFFDGVHMLPNGNKRIAEAICGHINIEDNRF